MCEVMGNPDWCQDETFLTRIGRWQNQDELNKLIANWMKDFTDYEVMRKLQKVRGSRGPFFNVEEVINDPHVEAARVI